MTWEKGFCRTSRVPRLDSLERGVTRRLAPLTPILLTTFGTVPLVAGIAQRLQVSAAIGAFLVGIAVSGPMAGQTHRLVAPLRDLFAATFFFFFGLQIDPATLPRALPFAVGLGVVTTLTKTLTGYWAVRRAGVDRRGRVRAGMALVAGRAARTAGTRKAIDSLLVLPFSNASGDPESEYLSEGIAESLINVLSQLPNLRVIPRTTALRFKGREGDPQSAARELNVRAVLTGKVLHRGDSLVVQTDLVDVLNDAQLWGGKYNRQMADIFAVQDDIANEISEKFRLQLGVKEKKQLTKRYTQNTEAYKLYLRGCYYWNKLEPEALRKSIKCFEEAIKVDPGYALPYTGLSNAQRFLGFFSVLPPRQAFGAAKAAARKALEIDHTLAEAHSPMGAASEYCDGDLSGAEREHKRTIEPNPKYAMAHRRYAFHLLYRERCDEAIAEGKRSCDLEPFSVSSTYLAWVLHHARRYDEAIEECQRAIELEPNFWTSHAILGLAYEQKGQFSEAIAELPKALSLSGGLAIVLGMLGHLYGMSGRRDDAQAILTKLHELSK